MERVAVARIRVSALRPSQEGDCSDPPRPRNGGRAALFRRAASRPFASRSKIAFVRHPPPSAPAVARRAAVQLAAGRCGSSPRRPRERGETRMETIMASHAHPADDPAETGATHLLLQEMQVNLWQLL